MVNNLVILNIIIIFFLLNIKGDDKNKKCGKTQLIIDLSKKPKKGKAKTKVKAKRSESES